ncbi:leucine-rich repeat domain-containing protein [Chakrabartyella piscis]|uniref:leucine-rich repeat domain-containing protein n=1 Tax=Chakrabartyella piscis TaxID=2918914 RepID=UPI00295858FC|nr:leucine-rich repeat domain-containing protein [Chakrabartyella piscis]
MYKWGGIMGYRKVPKQIGQNKRKRQAKSLPSGFMVQMNHIILEVKRCEDALVFSFQTEDGSEYYKEEVFFTKEVMHEAMSKLSYEVCQERKYDDDDIGSWLKALSCGDATLGRRGVETLGFSRQWVEYFSDFISINGTSVFCHDLEYGGRYDLGYGYHFDLKNGLDWGLYEPKRKELETIKPFLVMKMLGIASPEIKLCCYHQNTPFGDFDIVLDMTMRLEMQEIVIPKEVEVVEGFQLAPAKVDGKPAETRITFAEGSNLRKWCVPPVEDLVELDFRNCKKLKEIQAGAFQDYKDLKRVHLPESITKIEDFAFGSSGLESLDLSHCKKLKYIPRSMCFKCESLREVRLPASISGMGEIVFMECKSLSSLDLSMCNQLSILECAVCRECTALEWVKLPKNIREIWGFAFAGCENLKTIELENCNMLKEIYHRAFCACGFSTIAFPKSLGYIGEEVFVACRQLETIDATRCYKRIEAELNAFDNIDIEVVYMANRRIKEPEIVVGGLITDNAWSKIFFISERDTWEDESLQKTK